MNYIIESGSALAIAAAISSTSVYAQSTLREEESRPDATASNADIGEIIVTANKREQNLSKVWTARDDWSGCIIS